MLVHISVSVPDKSAGNQAPCRDVAYVITDVGDQPTDFHRISPADTPPMAVVGHGVIGLDVRDFSPLERSKSPLPPVDPVTILVWMKELS